MISNSGLIRGTHFLMYTQSAALFGVRRTCPEHHGRCVPADPAGRKAVRWTVQAAPSTPTVYSLIAEPYSNDWLRDVAGVEDPEITPLRDFIASCSDRDPI